MKKAIIIIALSLMMAACQEPYEKAIDDYYKEHLNDPSSYECIKISKLQEVTPTTMFVWSHEDDPDLDVKLSKFVDDFRRDGRDPQEHWGWYATHEYRAANSFGGKTVCKDRVVFDDEGENIVRVERVK